MKEEQMQRDIINNLTRNKIHIEAIQATHIVKDRDCVVYNYRVIAPSATKRKETGVVQGGTSVMIHESAHQYIAQIARKRRGVTRSTMGQKNSRMPIQILTTYAPQNGHTGEDRRQHCGDVREILDETCKLHMIIWRGGADGQIGRDREEENAIKKIHT